MAERNIKTVSDLKRYHEQEHPDSHFFDRKTLKFFGEKISTMYLYRKTEQVTTYSGDTHTCYCLRSEQKLPTGGRRYAYHYFDVETLENILKAE